LGRLGLTLTYATSGLVLGHLASSGLRHGGRPGASAASRQRLPGVGGLVESLVVALLRQLMDRRIMLTGVRAAGDLPRCHGQVS
jgi:hypothetical protein